MSKNERKERRGRVRGGGRGGGRDGGRGGGGEQHKHPVKMDWLCGLEYLFLGSRGGALPKRADSS